MTEQEGESTVHPQPQTEGQRVWRKAVPVVHTRKYRFFIIINERPICKLQDCPKLVFGIGVFVFFLFSLADACCPGPIA